ncbi:hypothetical protein KHQ88_04430 [Mycoplasmatota bacterium]|nr:hypothetical protein KHQ88_04430 [Mycoplasmatota bacterium]
MDKSIKKISLIILLFFCVSITNINAREEAFPTTIDISSTTITPGQSGSILVKLNNATDLSGLSFDIHYDGSFFSFYDSNLYSVLNDANVVVNTDTEGVINVSITALEGVSYTGDIVRLYFTSTSDVTIDNHLLDLAIGEAYDSQLNPLEIKGGNGLISVETRVEEIESIYMYDQVSNNYLKIGDTFNYYFYSYNLNGLAAGNFQIYYDQDLFEVKQITPSNQLSNQDVIVSYNTDQLGYIDISYASLEGIYNNDLFIIEFEVISNVDSKSQISLVPRNLYNDNLEPYKANETSKEVITIKEEVIQDNPDIYISDYKGNIDNQFSVDVLIEANSHLAAGDFLIHYDQSLLEVISITEGGNITNNGGYLFYNPEYSNGTIQFSYINENGLSLEETFLTITFKAINISEDTNLSVSISASGLVDENFNEIDLDYKSSSIYLGEYKTVKYLDYDESLILEKSVPKLGEVSVPDNPQRQGTSFSHWETISSTSDLEVYQAVYTLNTEVLSFQDQSFVYDGLFKWLAVEGTFNGVRVEYDNNNKTNAGTYQVEADIYLDDVYQETLSAQLTINPKAIDITLNDNELVYGQDLTTDYSVTGLIDGDDLNIVYVTSDGLGVGTHVLEASVGNNNYHATISNSTLTITKAPLIITADNQTSVYGEPLNDLTYTVTGDIFYEDQINVTLEKEVGLDAKTYQIIVSASHKNYDITLENGTYTIEKATYDLSGISFEDKEIEYDGTSKSLYIEGELPEDVSVSYLNNGQTELGTYTITAVFTSNNENYNEIENKEATLTIIPGTITGVEFNDKVVTYDGNLYLIEALNIPEGASVEYNYTEGYQAAGTYALTAIISKTKYNDLELRATLTITKAPITITADDQSSAYGQALEPLTYTIDGSIYNSDELNISLSKETGQAAGTYTITIEASNPNYDITLENGTYTIVGEDIDISSLSFIDQTYTYDGEEKTLLIEGDLPDGIQEVIYVNNTLRDVGTTSAIVKFEVDDNYNPVENMLASLTITKANIEGIDLNGGEYIYDGQEKSFSLTSHLTQYGDEVEIVSEDTFAYSEAGEYQVSVIISHPNYNDLELSETLIIHKADMIIEKTDFDFIIGHNQIVIEHFSHQDLINYSLDGSNFNNSHHIIDLNEKTDYSISIYLEESDNYKMSNVIEVELKTYLSWDTFMININQGKSLSPSLEIRDIIIESMNEMILLSDEDQVNANDEIQSLIDEYNAYVQAINAEYHVIEDINENLYSSYVLVPLLLFEKALIERRFKQ